MEFNISELVSALEERQEKYVYDTLSFKNFKVVDYKKFKTNSLKDFFNGEFFFFMTWFIKFCSVRYDYWPVKVDDKLSKKIATYIYNQFHELKKVNKIEMRFVCEYVQHIKTSPLKNKTLDRIRSAMREYMVYQKKEFAIQHDDALQRVVHKIVKSSFKNYEEVQMIQTVETNEGFVPHDHIFPNEKHLVDGINTELKTLYKAMKSIDDKKYKMNSPRKNYRLI